MAKVIQLTHPNQVVEFINQDYTLEDYIHVVLKVNGLDESDSIKKSLTQVWYKAEKQIVIDRYIAQAEATQIHLLSYKVNSIPWKRTLKELVAIKEELAKLK